MAGLEKGYFKIKSGQGFFEDITQENGTIIGRQICELLKTPRVESFVREGGLVELLESSKEVQMALASQKEDQKNEAGMNGLKTSVTFMNDAVKKYEGKTNQALKDEIDARNESRGDNDRYTYSDKADKATLIGILATADWEASQKK